MLNKFSFTKGTTKEIMTSSVQAAIRDKQTPAAFEGAQSSSSSNSSYNNIMKSGYTAEIARLIKNEHPSTTKM